MTLRKVDRALVFIIISGVLVAGCAKRPQTLEVAAPPPTGAAVTQPPAVAPPAPPAPVAPPTPPPPAVAAQPAPTPAPTPAPAPAPARPAPAQYREVAALQPIYFDFDKSEIRPDAARILDVNLDWIRSNPGAQILIEGHCDERGTNEYNIALGERRAKATMNYLVERGAAASRITTISYGEERPLCVQLNEACWAKNRRAHFLARVP